MRSDRIVLFYDDDFEHGNGHDYDDQPCDSGHDDHQRTQEYHIMMIRWLTQMELQKRDDEGCGFSKSTHEVISNHISQCCRVEKSSSFAS